MKRSLMVLGVLTLLAAPVFVSAEAQSRMPSEARWSEQPPTPPMVAVDKERTVSSPQEQINQSLKVGRTFETTGYLGGYDPSITQGD